MDEVANERAVYETVDIRPGGTHTADVLNWSPFHTSQKEAYDVVWLPDCGGEWFTMFRMYDTETHDAELNKVLKEEAVLRIERIILCQMFILKPGGRLYLGKILMDPPEFFAALVLSLHCRKFIDKGDPDNIQIKQFTLHAEDDLTYVVLQKKPANVPIPGGEGRI